MFSARRVVHFFATTVYPSGSSLDPMPASVHTCATTSATSGIGIVTSHSGVNTSRHRGAGHRFRAQSTTTFDAITETSVPRGDTSTSRNPAKIDSRLDGVY